MSDTSIRTADASGPFQLRTVAILLALGIISFAGLLLLGAYAPDLRSNRNGGGHALSNGAVGFSALVKLAQGTGRNPRIIRSEDQFFTEDLLIVTPESAMVPMDSVMDARGSFPTLIILPKWDTEADPDHGGWVQWQNLKHVREPTGVLAPNYYFAMKRHPSGGAQLVSSGLPGNIQFTAPRPLQVITGMEPVENGDDAAEGRAVDAPRHRITPLITDGEGGIVLGQLDEGPLFILADPDLLSNLGMKDIGNAASALELLDWLNSNPPTGIGFDVSLNGLGQSRSPLKLLFEPPFLPMTLTIVAALLLAGVQAFARFGPPRQRARALAFGKTALVDNSAALMRKARREGALGPRYVDVIRERAVAAFGLPAHLRDDALDARLDQLSDEPRFTDLVAAAHMADDRASMLASARALHAWLGEKNR